MKTIKAQRVTPENLKDFGKVIRIDDGMKPDASSETVTYYGQLGIMNCDGPVQVGICRTTNRQYFVEELEQHVQTAEILAALDGDFVTLVTSSVKIDGKLCPDMEKITAIRVHQGEGVLFDEGIWHWTPFAITDSCDILVIFKKETPSNDFITHRLEDMIEIQL